MRPVQRTDISKELGEAFPASSKMHLRCRHGERGWELMAWRLEKKAGGTGQMKPGQGRGRGEEAVEATPRSCLACSPLAQVSNSLSICGVDS